MSETDVHRDRILGILERARQAGDGAMGEPAIADELGIEVTRMSGILSQMQHDGHVQRTAHGSWQITPAAARHTEPVPSPDEPPQA